MTSKLFPCLCPLEHNSNTSSDPSNYDADRAIVTHVSAKNKPPPPFISSTSFNHLIFDQKQQHFPQNYLNFRCRVERLDYLSVELIYRNVYVVDESCLIRCIEFRMQKQLKVATALGECSVRQVQCWKFRIKLSTRFKCLRILYLLQFSFVQPCLPACYSY